MYVKGGSQKDLLLYSTALKTRTAVYGKGAGL